MSLRYSYFTCTILAAGLVAAIGGISRAEEVKIANNYYQAGCTDACAGNGCTADSCAGNGCGTASSACGSCNACGGGLFSGHHKHSWRGASCGSACGGCRGGRNMFEGMDPHFNCGCNGSYNFPVPPLSTYMWPGMYKDQLMTNYDNPWRFPPLKPYTDEAADVLPEAFRKNYPEKAPPPVIDLEEEVEASAGAGLLIHPVSNRREMPTRSYTGVETMSQKMERYYSSSR